MLRTPALVLLTATAAFALNGCVIYTNPDATAPTQRRTTVARTQPAATPAKKPAAKPASRTPTPAKPSVGRPAVDPPTARPTRPAPLPERAPRITSPIIFGNGTGGAFKGLAYVIPPNTRRMPDFNQLVPFATLFTDSFDVRPQIFSGGFPGTLRQEEWFGIRYEGTFLIPADGFYVFELISDDGSELFIDGQRIIQNDGLHTSVAALGQKDLKAGAHHLRLDYFQGNKGPVSLMLSVVANGQKMQVVGVRPRS